MALERTELIKGQLVRIATAHEQEFPKLRGRLLHIECMLAGQVKVKILRGNSEAVWLNKEQLVQVEAS
jgi:hypothetical protein